MWIYYVDGFVVLLCIVALLVLRSNVSSNPAPIFSLIFGSLLIVIAFVAGHGITNALDSAIGISIRDYSIIARSVHVFGHMLWGISLYLLIREIFFN